MKIIFMGTPDFSVPTLNALAQAGHEVAAVYTQPPRASGRGQSSRPTPVHRAAEQLGLAVRTPATLRDTADQQAFAALDADVAIVVAYARSLTTIPSSTRWAPRSRRPRACLIAGLSIDAASCRRRFRGVTMGD